MFLCYNDNNFVCIKKMISVDAVGCGGVIPPPSWLEEHIHHKQIQAISHFNSSVHREKHIDVMCVHGHTGYSVFACVQLFLKVHRLVKSVNSLYCFAKSENSLMCLEGWWCGQLEGRTPWPHEHTQAINPNTYRLYAMSYYMLFSLAIWGSQYPSQYYYLNLLRTHAGYKP